jgi:hypothetical protein
MTKHVAWQSRPQSAVRKTTRRSAAIAGASAGALTLLGVTAAMAISVVLFPGGSLPTPATTAATEPDLPGGVIVDRLVPFTIKNVDGRVVCAGNLQDRVVRSTKTGHLHFYYRIRDTKGAGAIGRIATESFAGLPISVGYRTDGLGTVAPRFASRSAWPGPVVSFEFVDPPLLCARHQESRFILIKTPATAFHKGGKTAIFATTGEATTLPTVQP